MNKTIGIIGTGAIAEAVVTGLCRKVHPPEKILLSPRNAHRAASLAGKFPNVSVASDNRMVVSASGLVFLAVRPQVVETVLSKLTFEEDQRIVSFIAGFPIKRLEELVASSRKIVRMIPLPAIARHEGPLILSPPSAEIAELFQDLGSLIQVKKEEHLETLCAVTGMMAPYFGLLDQCVGWLSGHGIDESQAFEFVGALFQVLGHTPRDAREKDFSKVAKEHATPQGLNEQALRELTKIGWYGNVSKVLDLLHRRLEGKADFEAGIDPNE